ncbi:MAG: hypothetical protein JRH11_19790 [Deltaproteobacteria bacterium]|nr:hypothetical protein [Deltaproteobacteria bacterium]
MDSSVESLQAEWQEIERELKAALRTGLTAAETARASTAGSEADEIETLRSEVKRKNDLIGQLSDTVSRLNREMDETERRLRDETRGLKDRAGSQGEELAELRKWSDDLEAREGKLRSELQTTTSERDELKRTASRVTEELETETKLQEERYASLQDELKDTNLLVTEYEAAKKDSGRKLADAERRLKTAEESRTKLVGERDSLQGVAETSGKQSEELQERVGELEESLASHRTKAEGELKSLRRSESRWRGDAETARSRLGEVIGPLKAAVSLLESLPAGPGADEGGENEPAEADGSDED